MKNFKEILLSLQWFERRIQKGVMEYAGEHNWLVNSNANNMPTPTNIDPDGMIVNIKNDKELTQWVKARKKPCIKIGATSDLKVPGIEIDYYAIGELAADYFSRKQFRNFACLYPHPFKPEPWIQERIDGFTDTVKKHNGNLHLAYRSTENSKKSINDENKKKVEWFRNELAKLKLPCGILLTSDNIAPLLQIACFESKLLIPEDISLLGVDNNLMVCQYTPVPLSSVNLGWAKIGYKAASMLDQLMNGKKLPDKKIKVKPIGVIERQSSSIIAVEDRNVSKAITYIKRKLLENPTVTDICEAVKIPRRKLERAFRKHLDRGIKEEVNLARITAVKTLLLRSDFNTVEIARKANFNTEYQMYKLFKKHTGMTAKEFREKYRVTN